MQTKFLFMTFIYASVQAGLLNKQSEQNIPFPHYSLANDVSSSFYTLTSPSLVHSSHPIANVVHSPSIASIHPIPVASVYDNHHLDPTNIHYIHSPDVHYLSPPAAVTHHIISAPSPQYLTSIKQYASSPSTIQHIPISGRYLQPFSQASSTSNEPSIRNQYVQSFYSRGSVPPTDQFKSSLDSRASTVEYRKNPVSSFGNSGDGYNITKAIFRSQPKQDIDTYDSSSRFSSAQKETTTASALQNQVDLFSAAAKIQKSSVSSGKTLIPEIGKPATSYSLAGNVATVQFSSPAVNYNW